jgi:hypothetical protein
MRNSVVIGGLGAVAAACGSASAQPFTLDWYTIDSGGGTSSGGVFTLSGTVGQHDAGTSSGGVFTLNGGFWQGVGPVGCDSIDFNGDGVFPDLNDIIDFFFVFGGGPCPTVTCNDLDFNNDGVTPDLQDLIKFLDVYGGGEC